MRAVIYLNTYRAEKELVVIFKDQKKILGPKRERPESGPTATCEIRYDDECGNGHNTFSVTGEIRKERAGACGEELAKRFFPELEPLLKWHLCSSDGPLHYIENALFWLGWRGDYKDTPSIEHFKKTVVFGEAVGDGAITPEELVADHGARLGKTVNKYGKSEDDIKAWLKNRLPSLLKNFRQAVESTGLKWD